MLIGQRKSGTMFYLSDETNVSMFVSCDIKYVTRNIEKYLYSDCIIFKGWCFDVSLSEIKNVCE